MIGLFNRALSQGESVISCESCRRLMVWDDIGVNSVIRCSGRNKPMDCRAARLEKIELSTVATHPAGCPGSRSADCPKTGHRGPVPTRQALPGLAWQLIGNLALPRNRWVICSSTQAFVRAQRKGLDHSILKLEMHLEDESAIGIGVTSSPTPHPLPDATQDYPQ